MIGRHGSLLSFLAVSSALLGCDSGTSFEKPKEKPVVTAPGAADPDAPEEFTTTESGLKYRIRRKSDGKKPGPENTIKVNYRGWLDDGTIFDTTYGTGGTPNTFGVSHVVKGFTEGIQLIGEGAMIELEIPYELGYGTQGSPPTVPPKATLHFLVELLEVQDPPATVPTRTNPQTGPLAPGPVDADAPEEFTATPSGLKYRIRRKSDGKKPTLANTVTVHYRGWLDDGKEFDASYPRGETTEFALAGVIKGWTEGLQLIGVGGMIELEIPAELAYGGAGNSGIPPNSRLHFIVELISVR